LDHLESMRMFVKVADSGSFIRAADSLNVSAAAATRLVAALEKRLGARLLQRTTRNVSLTEVGRTFLQRANRILQDLEEAENLVSSQQCMPRGILRIGAPVAFGLQYLGPLLKAYTDAYPQVVPEVVLSPDPIDMVEHRFDAAIIPDGYNHTGSLIMRRFATSTLRLVATREYLERRGSPLQLADLREHVFLAHSVEGLGAPQRLLEPIKETLQKIDKQIVANNLEMIYRFAMTGLGIAALPDYLVQADLASGTLIRVLPEVKLPSLHLNVAYASRKNLAMKVRTFIDFVLHYFGAAEAHGMVP